MSCDPRFKEVPRNWAVMFLPYVGEVDGVSVETIIGYPNPNRGYGYGDWVEFYATEHEARARFALLSKSGAVERMDLRKSGGSRLMGTLMDQWFDDPGFAR